MQVKLTPRLEKIASLVENHSRVADIGTDHGYIPLYLLQNRISSFAIASDVNKKPLESAEANIKIYGYGGKIETRLGGGLATLRPGEVDTIIIAGMGGLLISDILEEAQDIVESTKTFILQPMQAQEELRRYLVKNGFCIKLDQLVKEDHRIYEIIVAEKGTQTVEKDIFYTVGFHLKSNPLPLAEEFIQRKMMIYEKIMNDIKGLTSDGAKEKYGMAHDMFNELREVMAWLKE
ncbi:tRNA (adenine(22)-N(1))-methyltransferase [Alkaliphilus hydrothermalis]|uniref:tRNA (Adenine22-N1)-methyltransferase n=1 Tax=Alkaliphilus hydrothermalis TaxID=1482730 RepID=A0ABS2NP81_9FIRM|nr:class I SAM-dependent methyltransferase [Alkaliphilus hydrothermalis]MBM7614627.1 tRNA (adenine22-N1)-methyltransferase [Alkaliphilus hydrothermalis]